MKPPLPSRGEIWLVDLGHPIGHEQAGKRPCLVISVDYFNHGPAELHVVIPMTTREKHIPLHVEAGTEETGLSKRGFLKCDDVRSISRQRFVKRLGTLSPATLTCVEEQMRRLLGL
ncbi:MAG: type II toxin-antitoxin system PemK/MazF family toxin [Acidobacteria bacterium]|nr:type II toxin-antitoxin system PemK/MazF family toxin [Acidobacteriota bacterium]